MHRNQRLPESFEPHRKWILDHLSESNVPEGWIFSDGEWTLQVSNHSNQRIEHLEYILTSQTQIGILRFSAVVNSTNSYVILYLYDGSVFSHSIFQPMNLEEHIQSQSSLKEQWWIEPWNIEHILC